jgi:hypothetical protein
MNSSWESLPAKIIKAGQLFGLAVTYDLTVKKRETGVNVEYVSGVTVNSFNLILHSVDGKDLEEALDKMWSWYQEELSPG